MRTRSHGCHLALASGSCTALRRSHGRPERKPKLDAVIDDPGNELLPYALLEAQSPYFSIVLSVRDRLEGARWLTICPDCGDDLEWHVWL